MSDDIPSPDQVPGAPHPRETVRLFGQDAAEQAFLTAYTSDRLHHGWLLTGPRGVGKATLAWRIARFLLATPPAEDVALFEADYLLDAYPELAMARYGFEERPRDGLALMDGIAEKRRFLGRGGVPDLHKVSEILLNEFRSGKLGRISLETPAMVEQEAREEAERQREKSDKA